MRTDRIKVLLVISIVLTVLSGILTYFAAVESRKQVDLVLHSHTTLRQSSEILSSVSRAESGARGYMLTWDSSFLETFFEAKKKHVTQLQTLANLSTDNKDQAKLVAETITPYVLYKIEQLEIVVSLARDEGVQHAVDYSYGRKPKLSLSNLQSAITSFNGFEEKRLQERLTSLNTILDRQNKIRYISFFLIGITLVFAFQTITDKQKKNDELIATLNQSNSVLEQKVKERTHELDRKNSAMAELNAQLQQSVEEIQSFYETLQLRNQKTEDTLYEVHDLYNNAPCGYHSLDVTGKFIRMNDTELRWLGYTREEVLNTLSFNDIITKDGQLLFAKLFPNFIKKGSIQDIEYEFKRKDGTTFPVVINSTVKYDDDGNYLMGRTTVFDISRRKDLELKLIKANDALIQLNVEKNNFLSVAAHDLKSPLSIVIGLINLIKYEKNLSPSQHEYVGFIEQSCINMQRLIYNLLDVNKIEQGGITLAPEKIQVRDLLDAHVKQFSESAAKKEITLHINDLTNGKHLHADKDCLNRVLENLISNALKFSPKQKAVFIKASNYDSVVRFEIIDQGPGIRHDELSKLFKRFERLSARPTGGESSSGLGLSIVKELVELMKGSVHVESTINSGTSFIVDLPAN